MKRPQLVLEALSFESPARMKLQQKFRELQAALKKGKQSPRARQLMEWQLEKLEGLLQRGSLTQQEYDAQKQRLLGG